MSKYRILENVNGFFIQKLVKKRKGLFDTTLVDEWESINMFYPDIPRKFATLESAKEFAKKLQAGNIYHEL